MSVAAWLAAWPFLTMFGAGVGVGLARLLLAGRRERDAIALAHTTLDAIRDKRVTAVERDRMERQAREVLAKVTPPGQEWRGQVVAEMYGRGILGDPPLVPACSRCGFATFAANGLCARCQATKTP